MNIDIFLRNCIFLVNSLKEISEVISIVSGLNWS